MKKLGAVLLSLVLMMGCPEKPDFDNGGTKPDGDGGTKPGQEVVKVEKVEIQPNQEITVQKGDIKEIFALLTPESATNQNVLWSAEPADAVKLTGGASGSCTVEVLSEAEGTVSITAASEENPSIKGSVTWNIMAYSEGTYTEIKRGLNTFQLVEKVVFDDQFNYDDLLSKITSQEGCQIPIEKSADGLKITYGGTKYDKDKSFPLTVNDDVHYIEVQAKIANPNTKSVTLGLGTAAANDSSKNDHRGWANEFINGYGGNWKFRVGNARTDGNITVPDALSHTYGMDFSGSMYKLYVDAPQTAETATLEKECAGQYLIASDARTYYFYVGQEADGENTLTIESIAFYKKVGGLDGPFGNTLKFYDAEQTVAAGSVSVYNGNKSWSLSSNELSYDLRCGTDAFVLYHEDNFDYTSMDELFNAPLSSDPSGAKKAWRKDETWNIVSTEPVTAVRDGKLILSNYRVDVNNPSSESYQKTIAKSPNLRKKAEIIRTQNSAAGGINFGEDVLFGYIEADLWVDHRTWGWGGQYWCGFYTLGTRKIGNMTPEVPTRDDWGALQGYEEACRQDERYKVSEIHVESEFDIWEEYGSYADMILHYWVSQQGTSSFVSNRGYNKRFHSDYKSGGWGQNLISARTSGGWNNAGEYLKAALAWTPEKAVFYLNGTPVYIINKSDQSRQTNLRNAISSVMDQSKYPGFGTNSLEVMPEIAQTIYLVIAAGASSDGVMVGKKPGTTCPFIYYDSFKYYKYVGSLEDKTQN